MTLERLAHLRAFARVRALHAHEVLRTLQNGDVHTFSSTQVDLPDSLADAVRSLQVLIPPDHLTADGYEKRPHVTVKYGIHDTSPKAASALVSNTGPITMTLGPTGVFEADDYDVVYVSVDSDALRQLNAKISAGVPVTDTHPEYTPHATVAYVEKGLGKIYDGNPTLNGMTATVDALRFISKDGTETLIRTAGGPGSGNFGHGGRPGQIGGSSSDEGVVHKITGPGIGAGMASYDPARPVTVHHTDKRDQNFEITGPTTGKVLVHKDDRGFVVTDARGKHPDEGGRRFTRVHHAYATKDEALAVAIKLAKTRVNDLENAHEWPDDDDLETLGGPGSGNFGHAGRPGEVGGSSSEDGSSWKDPGGQNHSGVTWKQPTDPKTGRPIPIKVDTVEDAVKLVSEGKVVEVKDVKSAYTLIDKLAELSQQAKANTGKEIDYDLCQVTVAGTNMFCTESLREAKVGTKEYKEGVPRIEMPQLAGLPEPGSEADNLPKNAKGEVDASAHFIHFLQGIGMKTTHEEVPAEKLRASQRELVGQNVGGMMRNKDFDPAKDPIFISSDNYVVDGHHRWAATVGRDAEDGHLGDSTMKVRRINAPISEVLHLANEYSKRFGIKQKGVGAGARHAGGSGSGNFGHSGRPGEVGGSANKDFESYMTANPHKSTFEIGIEIPLERKGKPQMAKLVRKEHHGEEWRIHNERGQYVYSEGFRYVTEHRKK